MSRTDPLRSALRVAPRPEYVEAISFNDWRLWHLPHEPRLEWLMHIPLGELREKRTAAKLKAMGVVPGVADYFLPQPIPPYAGLWCELKQQGLATWEAKWKACTPEQQAFLTAMQQRGYAIAIGSGWLDAAQQVCRYLGRDDLLRELT